MTSGMGRREALATGAALAAAAVIGSEANAQTKPSSVRTISTPRSARSSSLDSSRIACTLLESPCVRATCTKISGSTGILLWKNA